MDFTEYLTRQQGWFLDTFGPGVRDEGLIKHIEKEFDEIRKAPGDVEEWVDIIILGIEGALRNAKGSELERVLQVAECLQMKQGKNINREWPDWRTVDTEQPVEHIKDCKKLASRKAGGETLWKWR